MESVFIRLFNVSAAAVWLVAAVLVARLILRRAPKWTRLILWALVAVRLLVPFYVESPVSLVPSADTLPEDIAVTDEPRVHTGISALNAVVNPILEDRAGSDSLPEQSDAEADTAEPGASPARTPIRVAAAVWLSGIACMAIYAAVSYILLRRRLREAVYEGDRVWSCDKISSPFILGVIRPRIYMPSDLTGAGREMSLAHERAHLRRLDHLWKPLGFLILAVNWYNPAIWVAYLLLCRDVELACDERVIRTLGEGAKAPYARALIDSSLPKSPIAACPLAFGGNDIDERVKNVLNYKKPAFWIIIAAVLVCAAVAVFFLTAPKSDGAPGNGSDGAGQIAGQSDDDVEKRELWYCETPVLDSIYNDRAVLTLYPETKRYGLYICLVSDYLGAGEYTLSETNAADDTIICSDGTYTYTFVRVDGALEFDASRSDGPLYGSFKDGAIFRRDLYLDRIYSELDLQYFDINGDGVDERVGIGYGPTSGVYSFTVTALNKEGEYVCGGMFVTVHYLSLRFAEIGGERVIEATDQSGNTDVMYMSVSGSTIELTDENGEPVGLFGQAKSPGDRETAGGGN